MDETREAKKKECLKKCGALLARRDYTCARLREKLLSGGYEEEIADWALEKLKEAHYLDDERYARNFIQAHWEDRSKLRIRTDLEERGVPSDILSEVLREESEERGEEAEIRQIRGIVRYLVIYPCSLPLISWWVEMRSFWTTVSVCMKQSSGREEERNWIWKRGAGMSISRCPFPLQDGR